MTFVIRVGRDEATRDIAGIRERLAPPSRLALSKVLGIGAERELRNWWQRRDAESPNKRGWPRQHFWSRIAKRTAFDPSKTTETTATVVVADPAIAAKINGATIKATGAISPATGKPTRFLSIPMRAEAYGNWPRSGSIPGLFFVGARIGQGAYLAAREGGRLVFYYRLVPSVTVPKDPQALPPTEQLGTALSAIAASWILRKGGLK